MSKRATPPSTPSVQHLLVAAKQWEHDVVIPHCASCTRPCCGLTDVVLDLSAAEATHLYTIVRSAPAPLSDDTLPSSLRRQGKRYYAHGSPCPAFDNDSHRCAIYDTPHKPQGCSDFPVYDDGDAVTADTRCEAVAAHLDQLEDILVAALREGETLAVAQDDDGPFPGTFVSFLIEQSAPPSKTPAKPTARDRPKP